tara:strand:- start:15 stop:290 length:276 start_codon:yes stop_codon:yes gene_type:complete
MSYAIEYHKDVVHDDILKLSKEWRNAIKKSVEEKLTTRPEVFGKPLRYSLKGYRKLRIGDYRVIFRIKKNTVKILAIKHRSVAYAGIEKRI